VKLSSRSSDCEAAGEHSYRSSVMKALAGLAAYPMALDSLRPRTALRVPMDEDPAGEQSASPPSPQVVYSWVTAQAGPRWSPMWSGVVARNRTVRGDEASAQPHPFNGLACILIV